ncbi:MAG: uracil-DNA glycosylase [Chloroflexi bacterium]|nr:uracil-DNA glycosylase [Chloroflexota bacterium]
MTGGQTVSALDELNKRILVCPDCHLSQSRTIAVPGEGPEKVSLFFIGEAPGWHEDQQGRPFVGPAGQFLEQLLASIGLRRNEVFITNVVKCRPPGNRDPLPGEIAACSKYLDCQLDIIKPKVIVTLGRYSMTRFFPGETISKVHGTARKKDGAICFAMYHPAAALHQQSLRRTIEEDMRKIPALLAKLDKVPDTKEEPQQLSMF